jgi:protein involved in polysaccharide export with SLBB domain
LAAPEQSASCSKQFGAIRLILVFLAGGLLAFTFGSLQAADWPTNVLTQSIAETNSGATLGEPLSTASTTNRPDRSTNLVNVLDDTYRLAIGDQISYKIIEEEDEDPKELMVTDSGDLQVPYIGRYPAVGKTCKQLAQELKVALEKEYYLKATVVVAVDLKPKSRGKIYLVGAVGAPGPEDITGDEVLTVSKAVLRAGGLNSFADGKNVRVTRNSGTGAGSEKTFTINVTRIFEKGKTENDLVLQPGDLIFVPERLIRF